MTMLNRMDANRIEMVVPRSFGIVYLFVWFRQVKNSTRRSKHGAVRSKLVSAK